MVLGMDVGLSPGDFVLDGDPTPPKFSAHVHCSYYDFVIECSSSSSSILCIQFLALYAFCFFRKKFNRTQSVPVGL